jgi:hypothetical protein
MIELEKFDIIFKDILKHLEENCVYADAICGVLKESRAVIAAEYRVVYESALENFIKDKKKGLDRHKCTAVFMIAILRKLKTEKFDRDPQVSKLIREKIAIEVGIAVLITLINKEGGEENARLIEYWNSNNNTIRYPDALCESGDYIKNWAMCLYHARKRHPQHGDKLFVPSLANELLLIESYNRVLATN